MALSRAQKKDLISGYSEGMAAAPHAFLIGFQGIDVPQVTELRDKVRESGGHYIVVKNTLARLAVDGKALGALTDLFEGTTAVAYSADEPVALAKTLTEFAKTAPAIQFKGALLDGQAVAAEQIKEIADLPSREELIAKLLFLMQSPVTRFVRGLAAIPRQFVVVLDQVRAKKQEQG